MFVYCYKISYAKNNFSISKIVCEKVRSISTERYLGVGIQGEKHLYVYLCGTLQPIFSPLCNHHLYFNSLKELSAKELAKIMLNLRTPKNEKKRLILEEYAYNHS